MPVANVSFPSKYLFSFKLVKSYEPCFFQFFLLVKNMTMIFFLIEPQWWIIFDHVN